MSKFVVGGPISSKQIRQFALCNFLTFNLSWFLKILWLNPIIIYVFSWFEQIQTVASTVWKRVSLRPAVPWSKNMLTQILIVKSKSYMLSNTWCTKWSIPIVSFFILSLGIVGFYLNFRESPKKDEIMFLIYAKDFENGLIKMQTLLY